MPISEVLKTFIGVLKGVIYNQDVLSSNSLLRIKGDTQHKTLIGGFVSLGLMITMIVLFSNRIIDTLNKTIISSYSFKSNAYDPPGLNITTIGNGPFMLGLEIANLDLTSGPRYFNPILQITGLLNQVPQTSVEYALEPCTKQHWSGFPEIQESFDRIYMNTWLCLPKNTSFLIKGKYTSPEYYSMNVGINKCTNSSFDTRTCANQSQIDQFFIDNGLQYCSVYFTNPLINPGNDVYLQYYLEDTNYIAFSGTNGEEARIFVQDYQIQTDQSILPFTDSVVQTGGIISNAGLKSTLPNIGDTYAVFYFVKSTVSTAYSRSFQKLDDVFSYMGGLFGILLIAFSMISTYNTFKFEISLAGYLYRSENRGITEQKYNFLHYICHSFYDTLKSMNINPNWQKVQNYSQTRQEVLKQLDILFLLKRINFLQKSLSFLFTEHQMKGLHLASHLTIEQAALVRRSYKLKAKLKDEITALSKKQKNGREDSLNEKYLKTKVIPSKLEESESYIDQDNQVINLSFDSDRYSSESESSDEDEESILESIKLLRSEQSSNHISKRIWSSMDQRLQKMLEPMINRQEHKMDLVVYQDFEELSCNSLQNVDGLERRDQFLMNPSSRDEELQRGNNNEGYPRVRFSRLKAENYNGKV